MTFLSLLEPSSDQRKDVETVRQGKAAKMSAGLQKPGPSVVSLCEETMPSVEQDTDIGPSHDLATVQEKRMDQKQPLQASAASDSRPRTEDKVIDQGFPKSCHGGADEEIMQTPSEGTQILTPTSTPSVAGSEPRRRRRRTRPSRRGWQEMPFDDDLEQVFTWEAKVREEDQGSDASSDPGMPALDDPESLLLVEGEDPEGMLDDSPARLEWLRQKRDENEENEHLDRIMAMIGHERVKAHFLAVKERMAIAQRWQEDVKALSFNLVLNKGNQTVTRRIARLYAKFLFSIGVISRIIFKRTEKCSVPHDPPQGSPTVLFFSNADKITLDAEVKALVKKIRESRDQIVMVLSYADLSKKSGDALKCDVDAKKWFPEAIDLGDYSEGDLLQLLVRMIRRRSLEVEGGFESPALRVLVKRVLRRHGSKSSSDKIRTLKNELDVVCHRREARQDQEWVDWAKARSPSSNDCRNTAGAPGPLHAVRPEREALITRKDIFGPEPTDIRDSSEAWKAVQNMVGLDVVKKHITHLFDRAKSNYRREIQGLDPIPLNLNRVFMGGPGAGKTTVVELYGQIVAELGLVSKGQVISKTPADLISSDGTAGAVKKTRVALSEATGNVLIIDEFHMLYSSSGHGTDNTDRRRQGIVDTIVANVSGKPGEDRCVILAGCRERMSEMFHNSNPGLRRRFPQDADLVFDNYTDDQLCQILELKVAEAGDAQMSDHGRQAAREVLSRMSSRPRFGNGGDVENLLGRARLRQRERQRERLEAAGGQGDALGEEPPVVVLEAQDFDPDYDRASRADQNRDSLFAGFVGFDKIVQQFRGYQQMADGMRKHQIDPRPHIPWAFVFKGPPGTGKTSTARKMGKIFYDMGFLSSDEVVVCSVTDMIGQYSGQTGPKVRNLFETSLGKVLFVDEAYRLIPEHGSRFNHEAVGELVDAMTQPRYAGKMVVILAGYTEDMELLLRSNPGLRSRFPAHVTFPHMEPQHCTLHLKHELSKLNIDITDGQAAAGGEEESWKTAHGILAELTATEGWANGRDIETLAKTIITHVFVKTSTADTAGAQDGPAKLVVSIGEIIDFLQEMLRERKGSTGETDYLHCYL